MIDERQIVIGLITNSEYIRQIRHVWNSLYFESALSRKLSILCIEFYDRYTQAIGKEIELVNFESKFQKDEIKELKEDILPSLSEEYEKEGISQNLVDETLLHFQQRHLILYSETIQSLVNKNQIEDANKFISEFKPLEISVQNSLSKFIITAEQIRKKDKPKIIMLMKPWLKEGQITILYGQYGSGKSLLAISIAYVLGLKDDNEEADIGEWQVRSCTGTLYVDGELGEHEMEERIKQFEWLGRQQYRIRVLSIPEYQLATEDMFLLSQRANQMKIIRWLKEHKNYKLVILDSVSTLFGLEQENDNSEWNNKVNPFLRDLRALGVACILLHHAGKDNKRGLRGASSMGAMAHNIFRLTNHEKKNPDFGEAWFVLTKDKQRAGGKSFKTFALKYTQAEDESETHWQTTEIKY